MMAGMGSKRGTAELVVVRGEGSISPVRRLSAPSCRCRPGDVAQWVRLDLSGAQANALRDATVSAGVSLDAWLAVMIELLIALDAIDEAVGSPGRARARLSQALAGWPVAVAALPEWRTWQASLSRRSPPALDELPEVVLPQRLVARSGGSIDVSRAVGATSDWPLARSCELAASGRGQTLEAFALQVGLAGAPRERG